MSEEWFVSRKNQDSFIENEDIAPEIIEAGINEFINGYIEYLKFKEDSKTKRAIIQAERDKVITRLHAQKEIILAYYNLFFQDRRRVFNEMFSRIDECIKDGQIDEIDKYLSAIIGTLKVSPFQDFSDFKRQLQDKSRPLKL